MSHGNSAVLSISAARGAIRVRARSRTRSRISRCSSVSGSCGIPPILVPVVVHDLDVVAVGVEHEGAVVARVVLEPFTRGAVVPIAGGEGGAMELVHGRVVAGREGQVHVLGRRALVIDERTGAALA